MTLLGHITPEVMNIFLSEAADLLGQWDEACFAFENGSDRRESLLWISRTIQSLRRACRGVGLEDFSQTLNAVDEYVRLVLRLAGRPEGDVGETLILTHSVLSRWIVGMRMDPNYKEDLADFNDSLRQQKSKVNQMIEDERRLSEAKSISTETQIDETLIPDSETQERIAEFKKELENSSWSLFNEGDLRINQMISTVAKISAQQRIMEHMHKGNPESSQDLRRMITFNATLISELMENAVSLRLSPAQDLLERLGHFAIESAQAKGCAIQFDYDGHTNQIDKKMLSILWEPLSRIVRWVIENHYESPDERVKIGKLPMGVLRVVLTSNNSTFRITIEDDGRGFSDGELSQQGQACRTFVESAREILRENSVVLSIHSISGKSTRFELVGSVSPWITEAYFVTCGAHDFAVPQHQVEELIEPGTFSTHLLRGEKQLIEFNGRLYPFVTLVELLEKAPTLRRRVQATIAIEKGYVILVRYGRDNLAVGVDSVVSPGKVIVTPMQTHLSPIRGVTGTLISGRGEPVLMVDLQETSHSFFSLRKEREVA